MFFIIIFTYLRYKGPKWQLGTQKASSMYEMHETSLLSTHVSLDLYYYLLVSKNNDEEHWYVK